MYVFWKYDTYPYQIGGKVARETPAGFYVEGFGNYLTNRSAVQVALVDDAKGQQYEAALKDMDSQYNKACENIKSQFKLALAQRLAKITGK